MNYNTTEEVAPKKPFAGRDAQIASGAKAATATLGGSNQTTRQLSTLDDISERIARLERFASTIRDNISEIGHKLRDHADRSFGEYVYPEENATRPQVLDPAPLVNGALGVTHSAIANLEEELHRLNTALSYCALQAGRNCVLA